jgi:putative transposase
VGTLELPAELTPELGPPGMTVRPPRRARELHEATQVHPEQIIRKLREADRLLAEGREVPEVAKQLEVSEATYHRRHAKYHNLKADDVERLKVLESENARLKRIVADKGLQIERSRNWGGESGEPGPPGPRWFPTTPAPRAKPRCRRRWRVLRRVAVR